AVDVRGPVAESIELDEPHVDAEPGLPHPKGRIDLGEKAARQLLVGAHTDRLRTLPELGEELRAGLAAHVAGGEGVGQVPVGDEAAGGSDTRLALHGDLQRKPTAEGGCWTGRRRAAGCRFGGGAG